MYRFSLMAGALLGFAGVALGAFAAHGLKSHVSPGDLENFKTASHYQMLHALALFAIGVLGRGYPSVWLDRASLCFVAGTLIFSGSLYLLVLTQTRWLGAVTPIGGSLLLVGWALTAVAAWAAPSLGR